MMKGSKKMLNFNQNLLALRSLFLLLGFRLQLICIRDSQPFPRGLKRFQRGRKPFTWLSLFVFLTTQGYAGPQILFAGTEDPYASLTTGEQSQPGVSTSEVSTTSQTSIPSGSISGSESPLSSSDSSQVSGDEPLQQETQPGSVQEIIDEAKKIVMEFRHDTETEPKFVKLNLPFSNVNNQTSLSEDHPQLTQYPGAGYVQFEVSKGDERTVYTAEMTTDGKLRVSRSETFDSKGRQTKVQHLAYNDKGVLVSTTTATKEYDAEGRCIMTVSESKNFLDGQVTQNWMSTSIYKYGPEGKLVYEESFSKDMIKGFTSHKRLKEYFRNSSGQDLGFSESNKSYDAQGNVTYHYSNKNTKVYDDANHLIQDNAVQQTLDAQGQVTYRSEQNKVLTYANGWLTKEETVNTYLNQWQNGQSSSYTNTILYERDAHGNAIKESHGSRSSNMSTDDFNRKIERTFDSVSHKVLTEKMMMFSLGKRYYEERSTFAYRADGSLERKNLITEQYNSENEITNKNTFAEVYNTLGKMTSREQKNLRWDNTLGDFKVQFTFIQTWAYENGHLKMAINKNIDPAGMTYFEYKNVYDPRFSTDDPQRQYKYYDMGDGDLSAYDPNAGLLETSSVSHHPVSGKMSYESLTVYTLNAEGKRTSLKESVARYEPQSGKIESRNTSVFAVIDPSGSISGGSSFAPEIYPYRPQPIQRLTSSSHEIFNVEGIRTSFVSQKNYYDANGVLQKILGTVEKDGVSRQFTDIYEFSPRGLKSSVKRTVLRADGTLEFAEVREFQYGNRRNYYLRQPMPMLGNDPYVMTDIVAGTSSVATADSAFVYDRAVPCVWWPYPRGGAVENMGFKLTRYGTDGKTVIDQIAVSLSYTEVQPEEGDDGLEKPALSLWQAYYTKVTGIYSDGKGEIAIDGILEQDPSTFWSKSSEKLAAEIRLLAERARKIAIVKDFSARVKAGNDINGDGVVSAKDTALAKENFHIALEVLDAFIKDGQIVDINALDLNSDAKIDMADYEALFARIEKEIEANKPIVLEKMSFGKEGQLIVEKRMVNGVAKFFVKIQAPDPNAGGDITAPLLTVYEVEVKASYRLINESKQIVDGNNLLIRTTTGIIATSADGKKALKFVSVVTLDSYQNVKSRKDYLVEQTTVRDAILGLLRKQTVQHFDHDGIGKNKFYLSSQNLTFKDATKRSDLNQHESNIYKPDGALLKQSTSVSVKKDKVTISENKDTGESVIRVYKDGVQTYATRVKTSAVAITKSASGRIESLTIKRTTGTVTINIGQQAIDVKK